MSISLLPVEIKEQIFNHLSVNDLKTITSLASTYYTETGYVFSKRIFLVVSDDSISDLLKVIGDSSRTYTRVYLNVSRLSNLFLTRSTKNLRKLLEEIGHNIKELLIARDIYVPPMIFSMMPNLETVRFESRIYLKKAENKRGVVFSDDVFDDIIEEVVPHVPKSAVICLDRWCILCKCIIPPYIKLRRKDYGIKREEKIMQ